jgi:hypothetical protein
LLVLVLQYLIAWRGDNAAWRQADSEASRLGVLSMLHWRDLCIVALFALWINLHALVVLGLVLVVAAAISDAVQYRFDRRSRALLLIALLCLLATLVNPFGWHYWQAAEVLKSGSQAGYVDEWKPFWKRPQLSLNFVGGEACLALVALIAWWANPKRRWAHIAWLGLLSVMFVMSRRNLWMTAIVALMVMAANSPSLSSDALWTAWRHFTRQPELQGIPQGLRFAAHSGTVLVLVLCLALSARIYPADLHEYWPPRGISVRAPVKAAQLIVEKKLPGHIYNDYENSSYLQWSLNGVDKATGHVPSAGLHPLYLDLLNAYPDSVLTHDYFDILAANKRGLRLLQLQRINTVHLGDDHRKDGLAKYLNHNSAWKKLLDSKEGLLWTRKIAIPAAAHVHGGLLG